MASRSLRKGNLRFSLGSVPLKLFNAITSRNGISLLVLVIVAFLVLFWAKPAPTIETQPRTPTTPKASVLPKTVSIGTHGPATVYYAAGAGLAKVASDVGPIEVIVQPFTGPPSWLPPMIFSGKPELGVINAGEGWQAFTGGATPKPLPEGMTIRAPHERAWKELRTLLLGTDITLGMLVRKDSKYQAVPDLKGARIAWAFKGQPNTQLYNLAFLTLGGLTSKDIQTVEVPDAPSCTTALMEGRLDAAPLAVAMGAVIEANSRIGVRFVDTPLDRGKLRIAQGILPGVHITTHKAGSEVGVVKDTNLLSNPKLLVASTGLPDNVAYALVKVWWENYQKLEPFHPQFKGWTPSIYVSSRATVPYHPGAIAFYKEKGVWTPEMDQIQQLLLKGELPFSQ